MGRVVEALYGIHFIGLFRNLCYPGKALLKVVVVSGNRSFSGLVLVGRHSMEYSLKAVG